MRTIDAYLSGRATAIDASSLVYREDDGTFTLERDGVPAVSLGGPFPMAKRVIDTMRRTVGATNVSRDPEPRFPVAPALTPNEWARLPEHAVHDGLEDAITIAVRGKRFGAVVALANAALADDAPAKITHDRIKVMRDCAEALLLQGYDDYGLGRFADALASYLPTRD